MYVVSEWRRLDGYADNSVNAGAFALLALFVPVTTIACH